MYNCIVIYLPFRLTCEIYFMSIFLPKYPCPRESMVEIFRVPPLENLDKTKGNISFFFYRIRWFLLLFTIFVSRSIVYKFSQKHSQCTTTLFHFSSLFFWYCYSLWFFFFLPSFLLCYFQLYFSNVCDFCFQWEKNKIFFSGERKLFLVFYFCELTSFWSSFLVMLLFKLKKLRLISAFYRHICLF